jgi:hypothetical protein
MAVSEPRLGPKLENSLFFSLLAGNLGVETGSNAIASATNKIQGPDARTAASLHFIRGRLPAPSYQTNVLIYKPYYS